MKTTTLLLTCSLLLALGAASGTAETSQGEERVNAEDGRLLESKDVDLSDLFAGVPLDSEFGNDAGCDATGVDGYTWAQAGTPEGPCSHAVHTFSIQYTSMRCVDECRIDALDLITFVDFVVVECTAGSLAIVDWTAEEVLTITGECSTRVVGDPLSFPRWDSQGRGGSWSHTDNFEDALYHLIA